MDGFFYATGLVFWTCAAFAAIGLAILLARDFVFAIIFARRVVTVAGWRPDATRARKMRAFARIVWDLFRQPCDSVTGPGGTVHHPRHKREAAD